MVDRLQGCRRCTLKVVHQARSTSVNLSAITHISVYLRLSLAVLILDVQDRVVRCWECHGRRVLSMIPIVRMRTTTRSWIIGHLTVFSFTKMEEV
jgi:DNA-directed RNA polymerase subunit RPC12/RpoP